MSMADKRLLATRHSVSLFLKPFTFVVDYEYWPQDAAIGAAHSVELQSVKHGVDECLDDLASRWPEVVAAIETRCLKLHE